MNGTRYFFDTNAIIAFLKGHSFIQQAIDKADWIGTSVISVIEFLAFPQLNAEDQSLFYKFLQRIEVVELAADLSFLESIAMLRRENKLKLPDAVIAGCALQQKATLITNDKHFRNIESLSLLSFEQP